MFYSFLGLISFLKLYQDWSSVSAIVLKNMNRFIDVVINNGSTVCLLSFDHSILEIFRYSAAMIPNLVALQIEEDRFSF